MQKEITDFKQGEYCTFEVRNLNLPEEPNFELVVQSKVVEEFDGSYLWVSPQFKFVSGRRDHFEIFCRDYSFDVLVQDEEQFASEASYGIKGIFCVLVDAPEISDCSEISEQSEIFKDKELVWCPFLSNRPEELTLEDVFGTLKVSNRSIFVDKFGRLADAGEPFVYKINEENHHWILEIFGKDMQFPKGFEESRINKTRILAGTCGSDFVVLSNVFANLSDANLFAVQNFVIENNAIVCTPETARKYLDDFKYAICLKSL